MQGDGNGIEDASVLGVARGGQAGGIPIALICWKSSRDVLSMENCQTGESRNKALGYYPAGRAKTLPAVQTQVPAAPPHATLPAHAYYPKAQSINVKPEVH